MIMVSALIVDCYFYGSDVNFDYHTFIILATILFSDLQVRFRNTYVLKK